MGRREEVQNANTVWEILRQTKWWRDRDGKMHLRREMPIEYRTNLIGYLMRQAPSIVTAYTSKPAFNCAPDDVWAEIDAMMADPVTFVMGTPMFRKLLKDVVQFAGVTPEEIGFPPTNTMIIDRDVECDRPHSDVPSWINGRGWA